MVRSFLSFELTTGLRENCEPLQFRLESLIGPFGGRNRWAILKNSDGSREVRTQLTGFCEILELGLMEWNGNVEGFRAKRVGYALV